MHQLTAKCIKCGDEWPHEAPGEKTDDAVTGSMCPGCFGAAVRAKQTSKGYNPCYGMTPNCQDGGCRFFNQCIGGRV